MVRLSAASRAMLVVLALLFVSRAGAAAEPPAPAPASSAQPAPVEEAADSPRASMRAFFDLARRGRYQDAAAYLDVPRGQEKRAAELAGKLEAVLLQRLFIDPEQLSPSARGRSTDGLPSGTEELGRIVDRKGHPVPIRIVRHESRSPEDEARWVFSLSTVQHVDALYASLQDRWLRERLPPALLVQGPKALYYWQWIALPLLAALCVGVGRALAWASGALARRLFRSWAWAPRLLPRLKKPVTLAWALVLFALATPHLGLTLRAEDLIERLLKALAYLAFFWALFRSVVIVGEEVVTARWARGRPNVRSLTSVGVKLGRFVVAAFALMVALSELGYPVTTVIAGLGIGGVALALAAQKTVENLFGSVSILADQPFRVGDIIRVDAIEGTVETIGLRSTRIRTVDRTLVIIPNGKLADMRIESLGARERIRFSTKLRLSRDTTTAQLRDVVAGVRKLLEDHGSVRKQDVFVRVTGIGDSSFELDVAAPVETLDFLEFARVREELLLACIERVHEGGARLALPALDVATREAAS